VRGIEERGDPGLAVLRKGMQFAKENDAGAGTELLVYSFILWLQ